MEKKTVTVKILGKTREYPMGITYAEIVKEYEACDKISDCACDERWKVTGTA